MNQIARIGLDIAKRWFQIHAVDGAGREVLNRKLPRDKVLGFLAALPTCDIALEACSSSHYWGREIRRLGHCVSLISPNYVKPFSSAENPTRMTHVRSAKRRHGRTCGLCA